MALSLTCSSGISPRDTNAWNRTTLILDEWKRRKLSLSRSLKVDRFVTWHYSIWTDKIRILFSSAPCQHVKVYVVPGQRYRDKVITSDRSPGWWNFIRKNIWQKFPLDSYFWDCRQSYHSVMRKQRWQADLSLIREMNKERFLKSSADGFVHCVGDQRQLWIVCCRIHTGVGTTSSRAQEQY